MYGAESTSGRAMPGEMMGLTRGEAGGKTNVETDREARGETNGMTSRKKTATWLGIGVASPSASRVVEYPCVFRKIIGAIVKPMSSMSERRSERG
eukprot:939651-Amorphochlora_amoeboformis.AAC.4